MNNRQGGRRRGRSGPRPQGMSGNAGGNARDNRQRGNAAQLLEKYKSMARDAQLASDRVQTEYYLQFADHYFRVLSESRSRFEEQRRGREDFEDEEDLDEESMEAEGEDRQEARPEQRQDRRRERVERPERSDRSDGDSEGRRERLSRDDREQRRPRRERFNGQDRTETSDDGEQAPRIALDTLPPAIGITEQAAETRAPTDEQEEAPRPRRRTRRPRAAEEGDEIAPAA